MTSRPTELIKLGYQARRERRLEEAKRLFSEAVGLCRGASDDSLLASSLTGLGQIERDLVNNRAALQHYGEAVGIYRSGADPLRLAHTIRHLGDIFRHEQSLQEGRQCYEEALKIYREHAETTPLDLANAIRGFALLRGAAGESDEAKSLWQEARGLYESVDVQAGVQESDAQIARLTAS